MAMTEREFIDLTKSVMELAQQKAGLQGENKVLREQLEQRDKTIVEILQADNGALTKANNAMKKALELKKQNTLMLSALERMEDMSEIELLECGTLIRNTIAQVKSLTVSKRDGDTK